MINVRKTYLISQCVSKTQNLSQKSRSYVYFSWSTYRSYGQSRTMTILTSAPENYLKEKNKKNRGQQQYVCVVHIASKCRSCGRPHKARKRNAAWSAAWELQARDPESQVEIALLALTICQIRKVQSQAAGEELPHPSYPFPLTTTQCCQDKPIISRDLKKIIERILICKNNAFTKTDVMLDIRNH